MADHDPLNDAPVAESSHVPGTRPGAGLTSTPSVTTGSVPNDAAPSAAPRPRRRWWRAVAWGVPAVVLVVGGVAMGLYLYVLSHAVVRDAGASRRPIPQAFVFPLRLAERVNILIIGTDVTLDNRRQVTNLARADTLVLTSFDPERRRMVAMSIPRDTRAEIPGYGTTKVNASYAYGAVALTMRTVEQMTGVKVHFFVKLGSESFRHIIDALGGVEVDVEKDMKYTDSWAGYRIDLKKGRQRLNGEQATGYIRFRHDAMGDIGRVERQRKVMHALLRELRQPSVVIATPKLLHAFATNTQTNLTTSELLTLGVFAMRDAALQEATLPGTFAPLYWEPDVPKLRRLVADLFFNVDAGDLAGLNVEIVNATGLSGLGYQAAARLQGYGFRSIKVRTGAPAEVTRVIDRTGRRHVARMVASTLRRAVIGQDPRRGAADITIVLARDQRGGTRSTMIRPISPP